MRQPSIELKSGQTLQCTLARSCLSWRLDTERHVLYCSLMDANSSCTYIERQWKRRRPTFAQLRCNLKTTQTSLTLVRIPYPHYIYVNLVNFFGDDLLILFSISPLVQFNLLNWLGSVVISEKPMPLKFNSRIRECLLQSFMKLLLLYLTALPVFEAINPGCRRLRSCNKPR